MSNIKLYKSTTDKKLAGVCGGLAEVLNIDPSIVRILWALLSVFWGTGLILYIIAALVLPEGKPQNYKKDHNPSDFNNNSNQNNYTSKTQTEEEQTAYDVNYKEVKNFDDVEQ